MNTDCSTIDAAGQLKKLTASAIKNTAVSLDIQNAFNSMPWTRILETLVNAKVPVYHPNIIRDYFWDWVVFSPTASGMVRKEMTYGVPQRSVLGPPAIEYHLWRHFEGGSPTGGKYLLLHWWYPGDYGRMMPHACVEGEHHPWGYDPLDHIGRIEPSNHKDGSGAAYTPLVQSPSLHLKGEQISLCTVLKYLGCGSIESWLLRSMSSGQQPKLRGSLWA